MNDADRGPVRRSREGARRHHRACVGGKMGPTLARMAKRAAQGAASSALRGSAKRACANSFSPTGIECMRPIY